MYLTSQVSTHSRPKAAGEGRLLRFRVVKVSTHSRPKAAGGAPQDLDSKLTVSTHSRPKAAGLRVFPMLDASFCFNTQPPEGGWDEPNHTPVAVFCFNTQPPEGGWGKPAF